MIEYIEGRIDAMSPTTIVIEAFGVGFNINISLQTYDQIQGKEKTRLWIEEQTRQDAPAVLFGFYKKDERELFRLLNGVSGVGGMTARTLLSTYSVEELQSIVMNEDVNSLKRAKGIGLRTAQRIIVDLKDKIGFAGADASIPLVGKLDTQVHEAVGALTALGFEPRQTQRVVNDIAKNANGSLSVEQLIKEALKKL